MSIFMIVLLLVGLLIAIPVGFFGLIGLLWLWANSSRERGWTSLIAIGLILIAYIVIWCYGVASLLEGIST